MTFEIHKTNIFIINLELKHTAIGIIREGEYELTEARRMERQKVNIKRLKTWKPSLQHIISLVVKLDKKAGGGELIQDGKSISNINKCCQFFQISNHQSIVKAKEALTSFHLRQFEGNVVSYRYDIFILTCSPRCFDSNYNLPEFDIQLQLSL